MTSEPDSLTGQIDFLKEIVGEESEIVNDTLPLAFLNVLGYCDPRHEIPVYEWKKEEPIRSGCMHRGTEEVCRFVKNDSFEGISMVENTRKGSGQSAVKFKVQCAQKHWQLIGCWIQCLVALTLFNEF
jgi:hypothetical protein